MPKPALPPLVFDRNAIRELDTHALTQCNIRGIDLMERASQGATAIAITLLPRGGRVAIVCGVGNNAGDGWAMGRQLHASGYDVHMVSPQSTATGSDAAINERRTRALGVPVHSSMAMCPKSDLVVDAILGTGLDRDVVGSPLTLIQAINSLQSLVLAVDIPSGLDVNSGQPRGAAVVATATATFVGLKVGMLKASAQPYIGAVHVVDIGVPRVLAQAMALDI